MKILNKMHMGNICPRCDKKFVGYIYGLEDWEKKDFCCSNCFVGRIIGNDVFTPKERIEAEKKLKKNNEIFMEIEDSNNNNMGNVIFFCSHKLEPHRMSGERFVVNLVNEKERFQHIMIQKQVRETN